MKKLKSNRRSRILEMVVDDRYERASATVKHSGDLIGQAKKLLEHAKERRKENDLAKPFANAGQESKSAIERARELVKQSRELIADSRRRRT